VARADNDAFDPVNSLDPTAHLGVGSVAPVVGVENEWRPQWPSALTAQPMSTDGVDIRQKTRTRKASVSRE